MQGKCKTVPRQFLANGNREAEIVNCCSLLRSVQLTGNLSSICHEIYGGEGFCIVANSQLSRYRIFIRLLRNDVVQSQCDCGGTAHRENLVDFVKCVIT